jgi:hypothetical protein
MSVTERCVALAYGLSKLKVPAREVPVMTLATAFSETQTEVVLMNQLKILKNQSFILSDLEQIKKNQETMGTIVKNQEKILAALLH